MIRHARATRVTVSIKKTRDKLKLTIKDNGSGFDVDFNQRKGSGLGLSTMQERARLLEGNLYIHSELNKGTTFTLTVPVEEKK